VRAGSAAELLTDSCLTALYDLAVRTVRYPSPIGEQRAIITTCDSDERP
jgi:hypothetical protein